MDRAGPGEWRREHLLRHRAHLAVHHGEWLRDPYRLHGDPNPQLRPVRQLRGGHQCGAPDHLLHRTALREGAVERGRQLGPPVELHGSCNQCTEVPGWPAISYAFNWVTASLHYRFWRGFEVYAEGKNLSNSVARSYLNGNPLLPWAPGQNVGASESGTGIGYSAYGRTYVLGLAYKY